MKDKILAALKTKFKEMGFSGKAFDGVADYLSKTVTDESAIDNAISGVEPLLKSFQGDIDNRVNKFKLENDKLKEELEKTKGGGNDDPEPNKKKPTPGETPEQKAIREMQAKLSAMESGKKNADLTAKARATMTEKKLPKAVIEMAMQGRTFEKEEDIETFVNQVEESHKQYVQELNDQGLGQSYNPPPSQATPAQKVESDISKWAEETTPAKK